MVSRSVIKRVDTLHIIDRARPLSWKHGQRLGDAVLPLCSAGSHSVQHISSLVVAAPLDPACRDISEHWSLNLGQSANTACFIGLIGLKYFFKLSPLCWSKSLSPSLSLPLSLSPKSIINTIKAKSDQIAKTPWSLCDKNLIEATPCNPLLCSGCLFVPVGTNNLGEIDYLCITFHQSVFFVFGILISNKDNCRLKLRSHNIQQNCKNIKPKIQETPSHEELECPQ